MSSKEKKNLDEIITTADKLELESLDKRGAFLNDLMAIEEKTLLLCELSLIGTLIYAAYTQSIYWVKGLVIGLVCFAHPWILWAIKFFGVPVDFTITDSLLIVSGVYMGISVIGSILGHMIDMANDEVDSILSKYSEEEN